MIRTQIKCPQCQIAVNWHDNPHRPFCSERCQLLDLGQWADESYRISCPSQTFLAEDENNKNK
ncbi:MAG: DNA gyrase inhibitor YacG [Desulfuromonadales bacterium]